MLKIRFNNIKKIYNGNIIFKNISGEVNNGDKVGLIGINGVGKSTLVKIVAGLENADTGNVKLSPETIRIGYLSQVFDEDNYEYLSGGEKTKKAFIKVLNGEYDFFILDEPTNHLDINGIKWLEKLINKINKPMIIISHDRFFLDNVANKIFEMGREGLDCFNGNYTQYRNQKEMKIKTLLQEHKKQQDQIESLEKMINERKQWFARAHKAAGVNDFQRAKSKKHVSVMKSKEKKLEKIKNNLVVVPKKDAVLNFKLINENVPKINIKMVDVTKSYDGKVLFKNVRFMVHGGDKIAIIGNNGCGKSTIVKIMMGLEKPDSGEVYVHPNIRVGYFAQQFENLNVDNTVIDELLLTGEDVNNIRLLLGCLLFRGEDVYKKISVLSMGERSRVAFAKIVLQKPQVIILDEPTNYMDIVSREKIEEVLKLFKGTVIAVSHDRYFIKRFALRQFHITDKRLRIFEGKYEDYEKYLKNNPKVNSRYAKDRILILECRLAYTAGKLDSAVGAEEIEQLDKEFFEIVAEIKALKGK